MSDYSATTLFYFPAGGASSGYGSRRDYSDVQRAAMSGCLSVVPCLPVGASAFWLALFMIDGERRG